MLLLKLPQLSVDIESPTKVGLPLLVSILRKVSVAKNTIEGRGERRKEPVSDRTSPYFYKQTVKHFGKYSCLRHGVLVIFFNT